MKTLRAYIEEHISSGLTEDQARSFTAQQIILSKIANSRFTDKVLLKGGVVMYNITQEQRRSTLDLDFDFMRYDIGKDSSIEFFVDVLNHSSPKYRVQLNGKPKELHQQDYKGKRVFLSISDETERIRFKLDIGVHTLFAMEQQKMCFSFQDGDEAVLLVNPPEQMFAEKLYSLAKIGPVSQRFKDIDDMCYLIEKEALRIDVVRQCLNLLADSHSYGINTLEDIVDYAEDALESEVFAEGYQTSASAWLGMEYAKTRDTLLAFIYKL